MKVNFEDVDQYIISFPKEVQGSLKNIRAIIKESAPESVESMSYGMPAYKLNGKPLIYFAAFTKHIGLYATPDGHGAFEEELSKYERGKGSVKLPFNEMLPLDLIKRIVIYRVSELG